MIDGPTLRAPDGLALSSRNGYLNESERTEAVQLSLALNILANALQTTHGKPALVRRVYEINHTFPIL